MAEFEPKQFGRFYLLEKLAIGGMAEIYKAKTFGVDGFEKLLAIKRILPHCSADKEFITMLIDEAKLTVHLSHANVVQVYDLGKVGDDYFISMEYINSVNLRDIIYRCRERNVKIPTDIVVYIVSEICKGLDYAHRKTDPTGNPLNIVHRDVSPQNILISFEGEVKIVDFGIAKAAMNISHTMAGILKGKIAYMSPEQALGKNVDHRTDIFSTAILLYEGLTGKKLFTGESQFEVLKKIRTTRIDLSRLPADLPQAIKDILIKGLTYYPKDRYQRAGDLQIDLTKFLYSTYPEFTPQKLSAFVRELFETELDDQKRRESLAHSTEAQTSTVNIAQEAIQEDIVHRDDTEVTIRRQVQTGSHISIQMDETAITSPGRIQPGGLGRFVKVMLILMLLGGSAYAYYSYLHPFLFPPTVVKPSAKSIGSLHVESSPPGAGILLNNSDTNLFTPADIDKLKLDSAYTITLIKEGFNRTSQDIRLNADMPHVDITLELQEAEGLLEITSEPTGAQIWVNGEPTNQSTPSKVEKLALNQDIIVTLFLEGYEKYEDSIKLTSEKPQSLSAKLKKSSEAVTTGSIIVGSKPSGALVWLNDKKLDQITPATLRGLEIGKTYTIRVVKKGFDGWSRTVKIIDTNPISLFDTLSEIPLAKKENKEKAEPKEEKKKPPKESGREAKSPPPPPPPKQDTTPPAEIAKTPGGAPGSISVDTDPSGAELFINDEYKGSTPLRVDNIKSGNVKVLIVKEGFAKVVRRLNLEPGETLALGKIKLGDVYGDVSLNSSPSRATVLFDGKDIGAKTPVTIRKVRRDQSHSITLKLDGYKPWSRHFDFDSDSTKNFNITLERE